MSTSSYVTPYKILIVTSPKGIRGIQKKMLREENILLTLAKLSDITARFAEGETKFFCKGKILANYDFVWIQSAGHTKDIAYMTSLYLDNIGIKHSLPEMEISKIVDLFALSLNALPIPKTYFCATRKLLKKQNYITGLFSYPFIVKATVGQGGTHVYLVTSSEEFVKLVPQLPDHKKFVCQEYIPNDYDYRIIVGNGVPLSAEKRTRTTDVFRNNVHLGATESFLDLADVPTKVKELAQKAANACNLSWAGVDIIADKRNGDFYIIEVNRHPGITKQSSETKATIAFLKDIKKNIFKS